MGDANDVDVFVSYAHVDRERVRPFVEKLKAAGLTVWWDTEIEIGSRWRHVIQERLEHAKSVCVLWSASSTERDFVLDEAQRAADRGILIPVLLDDVKPPLGFGGHHYASLANPATADEQMPRIISSIRELSQAGVDVPEWPPVEHGAERARSGMVSADRFLERIRERAEILRQNPGSAQALRAALDGVRDTYQVVLEATDQFLAPLTAGLPLDVPRYAPIASGGMVADIERRRGHCTHITQVYVESGGLRDSLPATVSSAAKDALDDLMSSLAGADDDLFRQMAGVGSALAKEGALIFNLLLAGQPQAAEAHLRQCAAKLVPLKQELSQGMGRVERLMVDLGIDVQAVESLRY